MKEDSEGHSETKKRMEMRIAAFMNEVFATLPVDRVSW